MADDVKTGADAAKAQGAQDTSEANQTSADVQNAADLGVSEGDIKALRDNAGLNQSAGHEANVHAWESSAAGKAFKDGEKDRQKALKDEAKTVDEQTDKDNLDKGAALYVEAVKSGKPPKDLQTALRGSSWT